MKTKLLRKIRRKYEVLEVVVPNGHYETVLFDLGFKFRMGVNVVVYYQTRQGTVDAILKKVRIDYPRREKSKGQYKKVWYK